MKDDIKSKNFIKTDFNDFITEAEINWNKEESWRIKEEFPIEVFVKKGWTGRYYVVEVPPGKMRYQTFIDLDDLGSGVDISHYDYENGKCNFTSYSLDSIQKWADKNSDKVIINRSEL